MGTGAWALRVLRRPGCVPRALRTPCAARVATTRCGGKRTRVLPGARGGTATAEAGKAGCPAWAVAAAGERPGRAPLRPQPPDSGGAGGDGPLTGSGGATPPPPRARGSPHARPWGQRARMRGGQRGPAEPRRPENVGRAGQWARGPSPRRARGSRNGGGGRRRGGGACVGAGGCVLPGEAAVRSRGAEGGSVPAPQTVFGNGLEVGRQQPLRAHPQPPQ